VHLFNSRIADLYLLSPLVLFRFLPPDLLILPPWVPRLYCFRPSFPYCLRELRYEPKENRFYRFEIPVLQSLFLICSLLLFLSFPRLSASPYPRSPRVPLEFVPGSGGHSIFPYAPNVCASLPRLLPLIFLFLSFLLFAAVPNQFRRTLVVTTRID